VQRQSAEDKGGLRAELNSIQSRVHLLEEERLKITSELATAKGESLASIKEDGKLRETITLLESKVESRDAEILLAKEGLLQLEVEKELLSRCELREEGERRERIAACAQLLAVQTESNHRVQMLENSNKEKIEELNKEVENISNLRDESIIESRKQADLVMGMESEVRQYKNALENASESQEAVEKVGKLTGEIEILRRRLNETTENKEHDIQKYSNEIKELTDQVKASEVQRRKLHNVIQELRGNVRVFARVRPFLPNDGLDLNSAPTPSINVWPDGSNLKITKVCNEKERPEDFSFGFDRVFGPSKSQESVFTEVSEFVQSALDGYNVCLFSYGQTGSGKTHTMQGSGSGTMRGIIPRAMQQVGQYKSELEVKGWEYEMEVSFIEIYNETIRDLLRTEKSNNSDLKYEIKKDATGKTYITDVTKIPVDPNNTEQMDGISELAARHRSVAQTAMNERSSRSHSIFALHLKATNKLQGIVLNGTLSLVDLAGSERLDRSGATGDRLKESVAINKSLSSLADVFVALGNKQTHVPFRNSKLTYLLQPSLSGDGKTLMMVNLSPTDDSYFESLCSLRFAKQVNQCELGKPKRQLDSISSTPESSKLATAATTKRLASSSTSSNSTPLQNKVAKKKL
jgi:kinesin family protein C1